MPSSSLLSCVRSPWRLRRVCGLFAALGALLAPVSARAEVPVTRTVSLLPASNGHGALMIDLKTARLTHFREHLFATEEPKLDDKGNELWNGNQPLTVPSRDLAYDAYFGLRSNGKQRWLTGLPVDADRSGYVGWKSGAKGGTGIASIVQTDGDLELTSYFFAPRAMPHNGFVMLVRVKNNGSAKVSGAQAFSIHNLHLGFGRPGVMSDISDQGETIVYDKTKGDFLERAFAGVMVGRGLGTIAHRGAWSSAGGQNAFTVVDQGGTTDLADVDGQQPTGDGSVSAFQINLGDINAGGEAWAGVAFAHHGDPFAGTTVQGWLDAYVGSQGPKALFDAEVADWVAFQNGLVVPPGLSADEETLFRHSAVMLRMGQSQEDQAYLREFLTTDGEPRYTRFAKDGETSPAKLPAVVKHRGKGAILASLPPGEWTVSWARDSAYAIVAMATAGMKTEARDALTYYLSAEGGRFQSWDELKPYSMPPYQISLVRYHGFGVEETDFNDFGPNLEFDGFGLMLWALAHYEARSQDKSLVDAAWPTISTKIGDALVGLVDPATGLIRKDSSIWETHWKGRERSWAYTSLTAARGLCDAATLAARVGDTARASSYKQAGLALRQAIATKLLDPQRAIASNLEELQSGSGYLDAAVLDAIAMELFDPKGTIAKGTFLALDAGLAVGAGAGWSRNDDRFDHGGGEDVSPWGGPYDSAEWVVTDMRGASASFLGGDTTRAQRLVKWTTDQALANYLEVSETYDESAGTYKYNAPMLGFGAGAYLLALEARAASPDPACGAYFDESTLPPIPSGAGGSGGAAGSGQAAGSGGSGTSGGSGGVSAGGSTAGDAGNGGTAAGQSAGGATAGTGAGGAAAGSAGTSAGATSAGGAGVGGAAGPGGATSAGGKGGSLSGSSGQGGAAAEGSGDDGGCQMSEGAAGRGGAWAALLALASLVRRRRSR